MKKHRLVRPNIQRLILFAEHLQKCKLENYPMEDYCTDNKAPFVITDAGVSFICYPYIYAELPNAFPITWDYLPDFGLIMYLPNHTFSSEESIREFFNLTSIQFLHLFVPYMQNKKHSDRRLHSRSTPKEVSQGIYDMLTFILPGWAKRAVLIEKIPAGFSAKKTIWNR